MKLNWVLGVFLVGLCNLAIAGQPLTVRNLQFSNDKVAAWETTIYPGKGQQLKMHRHDLDRIVVALTDGVLKITTDKGKTHLLKLTKDHSYYIPKEVPGEYHVDENIGNKPIKVIVISLN